MCYNYILIHKTVEQKNSKVIHLKGLINKNVKTTQYQPSEIQGIDILT